MKMFKHVVLFLCIFILTYILSCLILTPKTPDDMGGKTFYGGRGFEAEEKNTIEVFGIGNSDLYSGFNPMEMYKNYGYTSFASGIARCCTKTSYEFLIDICKKQKIKVVIVEVDFLFQDFKKAGSSQLLHKIQFLASPFLFHSRWKDLKKDDFTRLPRPSHNHDSLKGYRYSNVKYPYIYEEYMKENEIIEQIPSDSYYYLEKIRTYCLDNDIKIVFFALPSPYSWSYSKHNGVAEYAKQNQIYFKDFNIDYEEINFDFSQDFMDNGNHLNIYGSRKVTNAIAKDLKEYNILHDFRNDEFKETMHKWNNDLQFYQNKLQDDQITSFCDENN